MSRNNYRPFPGICREDIFVCLLRQGQSGAVSPRSLLLETALVASTALFAVRAVLTGPIASWAWIFIPVILVTAALVPSAIRHERFCLLPPVPGQIFRDMLLALAAAAVALPVTVVLLWVVPERSEFVAIGAAAAVPGQWPAWLVYQFLYVAVAEELFFRGYLQTNVAQMVRLKWPGSHRWHMYLTVVLSAGCFAMAHLFVQQRFISLLTFFPGLVLGWLFWRTGSLVAPIFFHGLANVMYCLCTIYI